MFVCVGEELLLEFGEMTKLRAQHEYVVEEGRNFRGARRPRYSSWTLIRVVMMPQIGRMGWYVGALGGDGSIKKCHTKTAGISSSLAPHRDRAVTYALIHNHPLHSWPTPTTKPIINIDETENLDP